MSADFLNSVEISSQEAAWWLLRKPMSLASAKIIFIPTCWPQDRQRFKKSSNELANLSDEDTDIWKQNVIEKYERRPDDLFALNLAQFCANYECNIQGIYKELKKTRIIRYVNYDMMSHNNDYKREMVLLYMPFRNEETDILGNSLFLQLYDNNQQLILERRKEFESNINIADTIRMCEQLCRDLDVDIHDNTQNQNNRLEIPQPSPFRQLYRDPNSVVNDDLRLATLSRLQAIAKRKENLMPNERFYELIRSTNIRQRSLLLEIIQLLTSERNNSLLLFLTGPAGCGKTFLIHLILHLYNKYATTSTHCNAYITCASTGKAAVAINGTTVHTAFCLTTCRENGLSDDLLHQYRSLFQHVKLIIIDEISMLGSEMLERVNKRLKLITGRHDLTFGGLDAILVGDLRQLPPVKATPIFKQSKHFVGEQAWRSFKIYELNEIMRQSNVAFSTILTKIGNGEELSDVELSIIQSRFITEEEVDRICPFGIRIAYSNKVVDRYNSTILERQEDKIISKAIDIIQGHQDNEQLNSTQRALDKKTLTTETGGLLKSLTLVIGQHYIITTNIDVADGLANGAIGKLSHIERNEDSEVTRIWLLFPICEIGLKARLVGRRYVVEHNINRNAVPISRRNATIYLNRTRTLSAKRNHFPIAPACALTIHKSQGGTFDEVVYYYEKGHSQQLSYVAMSRATTLEGLHLISVDKKRKFYHSRNCNDSASIALRNEMARLRSQPYTTSEQKLFDYISNRRGLSILSFNCQSLNAHANDLLDRIIQNCCILVLSETLMDTNDLPLIIPNFTFITQYRRQNSRNSGTAVYRSNDSLHYKIQNLLLPLQNANTHCCSTISNQTGDICAIECSVENHSLILISVYISPNTSMRNIQQFLARNLLQFTISGSRLLSGLLDEDSDDTTKFIILAGDFNVNFSLPSAEPLIQFLNNHFDLKMVNNKNKPTTKGGTTIDAIFSTKPENIEVHHLTTYFSYHNPLLSLINDL